MTPFRAIAVGIVLAVPLWVGSVAAQDKAHCDAVKAGAPQKVEGKVVRVDQMQGRVAVTATDGKTHEFQASKETLQGLKVGDQVEMRLRPDSSC